MSKWRVETVGNCLDRRPLPTTRKIPTHEYQSSGRYPIVDQGHGLIAGWTDDEHALVLDGLPVVVFGDHTRATKYVDFPFARGADGTQILKPRSDLEPRFFYYALRAIDLPSRGYNRHFKALQEQDILLPENDDEQRAISLVLNGIENALLLQGELLETLYRCKLASMRSLFTHGLQGELQKQTFIGLMPESWSATPLEEICIATDQVDLAAEGDRRVRYIDVSGVSRESLSVETTSEYSLKEAPSRARKRVRTGDVIVATVRPTLARIARIPDELDDQVCSTAFCVLRTGDPGGLGEFVYYAVQRPEFIDQLARIEAGASYPAVTDRQLKAQAIPLPRPDERAKIVAIIEAIDRKVSFHRGKRAVLGQLFGAMLHRFMTREISVGDLDLSALERLSTEGRLR